jgi:tripartite-type tricarboxylate transporter receptor subunit TctC
MFAKSLRLVATMLAASAIAAAHAEFPERPLTMIAPMAAGGGTDVVARVFAQKLAARLGQPVVVENRPGAGGQLGAQLVANARADGYTMLFTSSSVLTLPYLRKITFDLQRDFVPVGQVGVGNFAIVLNPKLPYHSLAEFVAAAKAQPGKFSYGSAGTGSAGHLAGELFKTRTGIDMVHVPFKSSSEISQALMAGTIDVSIDVLTVQKPQIEAGTVRGLATTGPLRDPVLPNLPTVNETNVASGGYEMTYWFGMFLPARTAPAVVQRVQKEFAVVMKDPEIQARIRAFSLVPSTFTPAQFQASIAAEVATWKPIIADNKIQAN